jgi:uncharacterized iron-regulated membrane protein
MTLYRVVWRWHFYAGLFVIPFIIVLALSGMTYLFKPQVERWEERAYQGLGVDGGFPADAQLKAALAAFPGSTFLSYRLPERSGDAAAITLALPQTNGQEMRQVFVSPQGKVLGSLDPDSRLMPIVSRLHGQLLLGPRGSWIVELVASWAIVMILSGLYLWWPRQRRLAGVLWPRLSLDGRAIWRDLHAVTGFWISILVLILLVTGLPWASVWGSAFRAVRAEMGWQKGPQNWTIGGRAPAAGGHDAHAAGAPEGKAQPMPDREVKRDIAASLTEMVAVAERERLAFPVVVIPPGAPQRFAAPVAAWTIKSESQNRPLQTKLLFDPASLAQVGREDFADLHPVDRAVGYGVAWHEGQLFGWVNQLAGVVTALGVITLSVTGFVMWRRRKPEGSLGAPMPSKEPDNAWILLVPLVILALLLPMLAISLVCVAVIDRIVLPWTPRFASWLGAEAPRG